MATQAPAPRTSVHAGVTTAPLLARPGFLDVPHMLYEQAYVWLVFLGSLDILFTWIILARGGVEVNPMAHWVIEAWGMPGAVAFKFALIMLAIVICEQVGRARPHLGRVLAWCGPGLNGVVVAWSAGLLAASWQELAQGAT